MKLKILFFLALSTTAWCATNVNLKMGTPAVTGSNCHIDQIVRRSGYALGFCNDHKEAAWVAYKLTSSHVKSTNAERKEVFQPDPDITKTAFKEDYKNSGYDRGHLCPAADNHWSTNAMKQCFYLSNMSPQKHTFNAGAWEKLEDTVRDFALAFGTVYVVTGPILNNSLSKTKSGSEVSVPDRFYKVVLYADGDQSQAIGFLLSTKTKTDDAIDSVVSVDEVEKATGLDFFQALPDNIENAVESESIPDEWFE